MSHSDSEIHCVDETVAENTGAWPGFYKSCRACEFDFVEIRSAFFYAFRAKQSFFSKLGSCYTSFNRNILTPLYLNSKTSVYVQIVITQLQYSWIDMNLKLTLRVSFNKWNWVMILSIWSFDFSEGILVCKLYTSLLLNLPLSPVSLIVCVMVDISKKKLQPESISRKSHVTTFMTSFLDSMYQRVSLVKFHENMPWKLGSQKAF